MLFRDIFVIGGSAGSGAVLKQAVQSLPEDLPASVFVSTHISGGRGSYLAALLASRSRLPVAVAQDGEAIERGRIYVAAPDRHLILTPDGLRLGTGPRENMARPAIDPMFRSAALAFGSRVVGVILSGRLGDGAAGLAAVKARGGLAVVQDPADAAAPDMPRAAIAATPPDYMTSAQRLGELVADLSRSEAGPALKPADDLVLEVEVAAGRAFEKASLSRRADLTALTCPDCGGVLSQVRGTNPLRFRCQIGHAISAEKLYVEQTGDVETALSVAMRLMEERAELVDRMARDARLIGRNAVAELYERRAVEYANYAGTIRQAVRLSLQGAPVTNNDRLAVPHEIGRRPKTR